MVTITLPEELPVNETLELLRQGRQMGIAARMVVVNQVPAMLLHASDRPLLEILQRESEEALARLALAAQGQLDGLDHARNRSSGCAAWRAPAWWSSGPAPDPRT